MRVEPDKTTWLAGGSPPQERKGLPAQFTPNARWWVTSSLTSLDDTRTPAFRRLPFACTLACLSQVVRAVEDWLAGYDDRGERLSSELEDLISVLEPDSVALNLHPATAAGLLQTARETVEFVAIRGIAADTRGPKQKRYVQIIRNLWNCRSEDDAIRVGPGRLSGMASELLAALMDTDEYRLQVQSTLAAMLSSDRPHEEVRYWTDHFLRMMQVMGHSSQWLQDKVAQVAKSLAFCQPSDDLGRILKKAFPVVHEADSRYLGVIALEPIPDQLPDDLPGWMKPMRREEVAERVERMPDGVFKQLAREEFGGSTQQVTNKRQFFVIAHKDILGVAATPWGRYTDQYDAARDIAAAATSTLQNYWAANPRRDLYLRPAVLIYVPDLFYSLVMLEWRQKSEDYQVRGLYELPLGIEAVFHWAHQSSAIDSPEAAFLCAWIAAEKLVARSHLRMASGRNAPDAVMIEWLTPILAVEEVWSRLQEVCFALHDLGLAARPNPQWLVDQLLSPAPAAQLVADCEPVPFLACELRDLSRCLAEPSAALQWVENRTTQIRRNLHRMRRLRNQIVHNAELDAAAAGFLSEILADYVRIGAYRTAALARNWSSLDEAFKSSRRRWREFVAMLQGGTSPLRLVWDQVLQLRQQ